MYKPGRRERPNQHKCCDSNLKSGLPPYADSSTLSFLPTAAAALSSVERVTERLAGSSSRSTAERLVFILLARSDFERCPAFISWAIWKAMTRLAATASPNNWWPAACGRRFALALTARFRRQGLLQVRSLSRRSTRTRWRPTPRSRCRTAKINSALAYVALLI